MSGGRFPTTEELELWRQVNEQTTAWSAVDDAAGPTAPDAPLPPLTGQTDPAPPVRHPLAGPVGSLDAKRERKLRQGRTVPDAQLDLHGLTADGARTVFTHFIQQCYSRQKRHVLVITGKGNRSKGHGAVLKKLLPHWLEEPLLKPLILSQSQAAPRHGGDGAFYILLRRQR
jgi:DNA-nicking Smr family endonuclease